MKKINNNIQESYCSFEVCKLLKEKGGIFEHCPVFLYDEFIAVDPYESMSEKDYTYIPTHALAIQWLWVNFGVWIVVYIDTSEFESTKFYFIVEKEENLNFGKYWDTPQQATEEALLYVLNNLIP